LASRRLRKPGARQCRLSAVHCAFNARLRSIADAGWRVVISVSMWGVLPLLLSLLGAQPGAVGQTVTRLIIQDEVILRVPVQPRPLFPEFEWVEKKGPKCIPAGAIQRALLSGSGQVDFVMANRARVRAQFDEDCPALDFYGGFYLQPADERLCARRDAVHSRMGGSCMIERFRELVPRYRH
jgi:hypothetical protein